jgi:TonB-linked SusC/RagA family outer membrane protein
VWDTTRYTDWQKELLGSSAAYTNINASLSGGTQLINYFIGGTFNRRTTIFSSEMDDKMGALHFNLNTSTANQRLTLQLTGSYSYDQNKLPTADLTSKALLLEPDAPPLYNQDGSLNWAPDAIGKSTWSNPLAQFVNNSDFNSSTKNLVSNLSISYEILKGLNVRTNLGYTNMQTDIFSSTRLEALAPETRPNGSRSAVYSTRNANTWIVEPQLLYIKTSGNNKIDGLVGTTIQKSSYSILNITGSGYASDQLMKSMLAAQNLNILTSVSGINRYNAVFGRFNYTYANKYIVNFTARRDGSNRFGDNNKFSNFWSTGAAWIFTDEPMVQKHSPFLSFGKIKVSYGITGNDQIPDFSYISVYNIDRPTLLYQNMLGFRTSNIPNPYLQWEKTSKLQLGVDLSFLKDRINLGITYACNQSSNQLVDYSVSAITGNISYPKNLPAVIQNTSWEFLLNTINLKKSNFSWNSNFNLTIPKNKLLSFQGIEKTTYSSPLNGIVVGQPVGVIAVYQYGGMSPSNGQYLSIDQNGNLSTFLNLPSKFITTNAKYYGGVINTFTYKGFQLDIFLQFLQRLGVRDFYWSNGSAVYPGGFTAGNSNQPTSVLNRWRKPGDDALVTMYSTTAGTASLITVTDKFYNYDASFIRLKNVSFSWQLPPSFIRKARIQNLRVFCNAQNLHVFTNYRGLDPETGATSLPPLQTVVFGTQVDF